eukprot:GFYU01008565.1.p1 GENE.GFYU01008565.1~~GFYU01008565.1.p1  ORF type:complete len:455 (-),score=80.62 GFYU01008565.1:44-1408(-)
MTEPKHTTPSTQLRELFDVAPSDVYIDSASRSLMPKSVFHVGVDAVARKLRPYERFPSSVGEREELRKQFASLINAEPKDIALTPSTSYSLSMVADNLKQRGLIDSTMNVVILQDQMSSNAICWQQLCRDTGATLRVVQRPTPSTHASYTDFDLTQAVCDHIDTNTAIVAIPNCHWTDGELIELSAVRAKCDAVSRPPTSTRGRHSDRGGANTGTDVVSIRLPLFILDVTQSLGVMDMDITKLPCDYLASSVHKWLLGPYGCGFLYVSPTHQHSGLALEHHDHNRLGGDDADEGPPFHATTGYPLDFLPAARRFDGGGRPNPILYPMILEGLRVLTQVIGGPHVVYSHTQRVTDYIEGRVTQMGFVTPHKRSPHILGVKIPRGGRISMTSHDICAQLKRHRIFVSSRSGGLRVAPHVYTTMQEAVKFCDTLESIVCHSGGRHGDTSVSPAMSSL